MSQSLENEGQISEALGIEQLEQVVGGNGPIKPEASRGLPVPPREDFTRIGGMNSRRKVVEYLPFGLIRSVNRPTDLKPSEGSSSNQGPSAFKPYVPDLNK